MSCNSCCGGKTSCAVPYNSRYISPNPSFCGNSNSSSSGNYGSAQAMSLYNQLLSLKGQLSQYWSRSDYLDQTYTYVPYPNTPLKVLFGLSQSINPGNVNTSSYDFLDGNNAYTSNASNTYSSGRNRGYRNNYNTSNNYPGNFNTSRYGTSNFNNSNASQVSSIGDVAGLGGNIFNRELNSIASGHVLQEFGFLTHPGTLRQSLAYGPIHHIATFTTARATYAPMEAINLFHTEIAIGALMNNFNGIQFLRGGQWEIKYFVVGDCNDCDASIGLFKTCDDGENDSCAQYIDCTRKRLDCKCLARGDWSGYLPEGVNLHLVSMGPNPIRLRQSTVSQGLVSAGLSVRNLDCSNCPNTNTNASAGINFSPYA